MVGGGVCLADFQPDPSSPHFARNTIYAIHITPPSKMKHHLEKLNTFYDFINRNPTPRWARQIELNIVVKKYLPEQNHVPLWVDSLTCK